MNLSDVPIKRKLRIAIMVTSSVVLLLTSFSFVTYEVLNFRKNHLEYTMAVAQVIASTSTAAVTFHDEKVGTEILSKLAADPSIMMAALYDAGGDLLARYPTNRAAADFPQHPQKIGQTFEVRSLKVFTPVRQDHRQMSQIGTLYLQTDLSAVYERFRLYGIIVSLVMLGSFFIALTLSNWLQKRISGPILELADTAKAVAIKKDYQIRAKKFGKDELGFLSDSFNNMLDQIHERDRAVTESEARTRAVLDSSVSAVVVIDTAGVIIDWNVRAEQIFGWSRHEAIGKLLAETIIPPKFREAHQRGLARYLTTGEGPILNKLLELSAVRRNGREFPVELSISPMKTGDVTTFCGFITDITERKEAAQALSLLAAIVESSDDAIMGKDLLGTIMSWNVGAEQMFGYTAKEAVGRKSSFILPPDRLEEEVQALARMRQGRIEHYETTRVRKDGSIFHISLTMSPIKDAEGKIIGVSTISRDISDRIAAEEKIRALNAELEERVLTRTAELAATNKELEAFTYSVSHDLRAPLRHIDAFAQMLEEEVKGDASAEGHRYIQRIRYGVQNMGKLVDDLLNLSRVGRLDFTNQKVQLNSLVNEVLVDLKPEYENRNIEWIIGELPVADCEPGLMKQVFTNLISNSIKYTRPREKAVIEIGQIKEKDETIIFVRDNGVGFNMKYANKLFGVFQRLHRAEDFEGTGVGLATVQRIIHLHQGRIWAEAAIDKGATFYFTLRGIQRT